LLEIDLNCGSGTTNLNETGKVAPERIYKWRAHIFPSCPPLSWLYKYNKSLWCISAFLADSTVWSVFCLLFFYL